MGQYLSRSYHGGATQKGTGRSVLTLTVVCGRAVCLAVTWRTP